MLTLERYNFLLNYIIEGLKTKGERGKNDMMNNVSLKRTWLLKTWGWWVLYFVEFIITSVSLIIPEYTILYHIEIIWKKWLIYGERMANACRLYKTNTCMFSYYLANFWLI